MDICKFCQERPANKKNTHYLTDAIIRTCLNEQGANIREKGVMYEISTIKDSIEFRFQRETSQDAITNALGRAPQENEIDKAKSIPFSVDYMFCSECENKFTVLETPFMEKIVPKLHGKDFTNVKEITFEEVIEIRLFFLLQLWRMGICDPTLKVSEDLLMHLRPILIDYESNLEALKSVSLNITYLSTMGGDMEYTHNKVGIISDNFVDAIAMNDFIIQFPADNNKINFVPLFGINDQKCNR